MKKLSFLMAGAFALFTYSCKDKPEPTPAPPSPPKDTTSLATKQKDTALLYARDIYLWNTNIPSTFSARAYPNLNELMKGIRQFSREPGFTDPVDRWSFAIDKKEWDDVSSGKAENLGMYVFFANEGDLRVRWVEINSPAWKAGIKRGWKITKINGDNNMTTANANKIIEGVYYSASSSFTFEKPEAGTVDITLTENAYQSNPVFKDSVYSIAGKKIGYLVFNSFLGDSAQVFGSFRRIFTEWEAAGVTNAVVDLRYNGGGYVYFQDKLASYLVPPSADGKVMMEQKFNDKYKQYNETSYFDKIGNLNLSKIVFVVSSSTASASELLINNLKPYLEVKIVGPSASYGKPVGYFPIEVGSEYIFPVSFRNTNANGEGNYFNGFKPENPANPKLDDVTRDWGNTNELALASALKYLTTGGFRLPSSTSAKDQVPMDPQAIKANEKLTGPVFKGMVSKSIF